MKARSAHGARGSPRVRSADRSAAAITMMQIGENKYGKPALDRIVRAEMSPEDAARLCLVSLDATSRSNVTVGPPFELAIYPRDH
jgi:predicted proteasome-type protease